MFKKTALSVVALTMAANAFAADSALQLQSNEDKASYGVGYNVGSSLKAQGFPNLNKQAIFAGIEDAIEDNPLRVSKEDLVTAFTAIQKKETEEKAKLSALNLQQGESFLSGNRAKQGVQSTESGLQYKVLKQGSGAKPKIDDVVVTNYRGTLIDGTEFDSSYKRNEPVEFPVNRVIPGWTEALQMMPVGSKWQLYIPAKLAYGEMSPSPAIPVNSTLIFDVELLDIKKAEQQPK